MEYPSQPSYTPKYESIFEELEKFGRSSIIVPGVAPVGKVDQGAMNNLLKEASEFDCRSAVGASSNSGDKEFNEVLLEEKSSASLPRSETQAKPMAPRIIPDKEVPEEASEVPIGQIENANGVPKVILDDKYLEQYKNDLLLRQDEFKK